MAEKNELSKEDFLSIAKVFGLNINDPHIEELFAYVQKILPTLKRIEELDLKDMEPWVALPHHRETVSQFAVRPSTRSGRTVK